MAGPIADRGCTDLICFLLFIASVGLMWGIAIYGYKNGTPSRLTAAYDADGNISYNLLLFFNKIFIK